MGIAPRAVANGSFTLVGFKTTNSLSTLALQPSHHHSSPLTTRRLHHCAARAPYSLVPPIDARSRPRPRRSTKGFTPRTVVLLGVACIAHRWCWTGRVLQLAACGSRQVVFESSRTSGPGTWGRARRGFVPRWRRGAGDRARPGLPLPLHAAILRC